MDIRGKFILSFIYGIGAMLAFSGVIPWANYYGLGNIGPFMMLWDIILGIAIYSL